MYTLVSASVLALDLSRHPHGAVLADVLDTTLVLGDALRAASPSGPERDAARRRLRALAAGGPRLSAALGGVSRAAEDGLRPAELAAARSALQSALVGRLDDLLALVLEQLDADPAVTSEEVEAVLDRLTSAWTAGLGTPGDHALLDGPWERLAPVLPTAPPGGASARRVSDLLEAVARTDAAAWHALDAAHARRHVGLSWSSLMHTASRAAVGTGRTQEVARWQLSAVRAAHCAGHALTECAPGAMMSVVGAVQVLCVRDAVADDVQDGLLAACRQVLGAVP